MRLPSLPLFLALLAFPAALGCADPAADAAFAVDTTAAPTGPVRSGAQVLADSGFAALQGMRVGLVVNHTARVDTAHLADRLAAAEDVELAALFGPEHGIRGTADAGEKVDDGRDARTGAPVYSLYGETRKPTPAMLEGLDALVFDIQDVGARFYTYISTMGLAMQAAAEADLPFYVLDRPNPLGGTRAEGFVLDTAYTSFVGQYPIPVTHGLTVGELAAMIQGEAWLPGLENLDLRVVEMDGWQRSMPWDATGQPWIKPSPNIPDVETALVYPGTAFFEGTSASEGRGTRTPFTLVGAPWADGQALADTLNARGLPGVRFEAAAFTPESIEGMASSPKLEGTPLEGVRLAVTDPQTFAPVAAGVHVLHAFYQQAPDDVRADDFFNDRWLRLLAGTPRLQEQLEAGARPEAIIASWQDEAAAFDTLRTPYLRY